MNKSIIIGDIHFGIYSNNQKFLNYQLEYFEKILFPYIIENGISRIYQLGDTFNSRKNTDNYILSEVKKRFFDWFDENEIGLTILIGNHDMYHLETNSHSPLFVYKSEYIEIVSRNTSHNNITVLPYMFDEEMLFDDRNDYCFAHLDIVGAMQNSNSVSKKGYNIELFKNFKRVYTGHYHSPSKIKNVTYIGSLFQLNFSNINEDHGFIVFDSQTGKEQWVSNEFSPKFINVNYKADKIEIEGLFEIKTFTNHKKALNYIGNNYVKLITRSVDDRLVYEDFKNSISNLKQKINLEILNDKFSIGEIDDNKVIDTHSLMTEYFDNLELSDSLNIDKIKDIFFQHYVNVKENNDKINSITNKLRFESMRFKNIVSFGDYWTEYKFEDGIFRLIAENGGGKTTLAIEVPNFLLFGTSALGKNKDNLINNITKKKLLVEGVFYINDDKIEVTRGLKPNIFKIVKNGKELEKTTNFQKVLDDIIGIDKKQLQYKMLKNKKNYVPFSLLDASKKRDYLETLFNLEVFGNILESVKLDIKDNKRVLELSEKDIDKWKMLIEKETDHIRDLEEMKETEINNQITSLTDSIEDIESDEKLEILQDSKEDKNRKLFVLKNKDVEIDFNNREIKIKKEISILKKEAKLQITEYRNNIDELSKQYDDLLVESKNKYNERHVKEIEIVRDEISTMKKEIKTDELNISNKKINEQRDTIISDINEINIFIAKKESSLESGNKRIRIMKKVCKDCDKIPKITSDMKLDIMQVSIDYENKELSKLKKLKTEIEVTLAENIKAMEKDFELQGDLFKLKKKLEKIEHTDEVELKVFNIRAENNIENMKKNLLERKTIKSKIKTYKESMLIKIKDKEQDIIDLNESKSTVISTLNEDILNISSEIESVEKAIKKLHKKNDKKIAEIKKEIVKLDVSLENIIIKDDERVRLENELEKENNRYEDEYQESLHNEFIRKMLLSDGNIKSYIVSQYLNHLNYSFNKILANFNVDFGILFDSSLNTSFLGGYENLTFDNLSSGEAQSVDFSIIFALDEMQEKMFGANVNFLVFDEIINGLDENKTKVIIDILKEMSKDKTIFIVEHLMQDEDIETINIVKDVNGSKILKK